ncbi:hypothetical protein BGY98DRAFT_923631, partial [Russula aff. rugulosa BPL654]
WTCKQLEWHAAAVMVGKHRYQRCLDSLKGMIVLRMFELTMLSNMLTSNQTLRDTCQGEASQSSLHGLTFQA